MGNPLQGEEKGVRLGEAAHPVECHLLLSGGIAGCSMGETAGKRHQTQQPRPKGPVLQPGPGPDVGYVLDGEDDNGGGSHRGTEQTAGGEPGEHAGGDEEKHEGRTPRTGEHDGSRVEGLLHDHSQTRSRVVAVGDRSRASVNRIEAGNGGDEQETPVVPREIGYGAYYGPAESRKSERPQGRGAQRGGAGLGFLGTEPSIGAL